LATINRSIKGEVHGLEYTVKANGGRCCEKSEENVDPFMQFIASMPNRKNGKWFDDGTYQGGTERSYPAVHIYEKDKRGITVFEKEIGQ
jgi:hypothetical protein